MDRGLVSEDDTISIPQVSNMSLKDAAESIHIFNLPSSPRHEVFFDFYRNIEKYRKQFNPEDIDDKYFVALYNGTTLTTDECYEAVLKGVDISGDWSVYLMLINTDGLYKEDGTPNYEESHYSMI